MLESLLDLILDIDGETYGVEEGYFDYDEEDDND